MNLFLSRHLFDGFVVNFVHRFVGLGRFAGVLQHRFHQHAVTIESEPGLHVIALIDLLFLGRQEIAFAESPSGDSGKSVNRRRHFPCWGQLSRQCRDNFPRNTSERNDSHNLFIRSGLCSSFTNAAGMAISAPMLALH